MLGNDKDPAEQGRGREGVPPDEESLDLTVPYVHGSATFRGKALVAFVALVMTQTLVHLAWSGGFVRKPDTLRTMMNELGKVVAYRDGSVWRRKYALIKKQKAIFGSLGLKEEDIDAEIGEIKG